MAESWGTCSSHTLDSLLLGVTYCISFVQRHIVQTLLVISWVSSYFFGSKYSLGYWVLKEKVSVEIVWGLSTVILLNSAGEPEILGSICTHFIPDQRLAYGSSSHS